MVLFEAVGVHVRVPVIPELCITNWLDVADKFIVGVVTDPVKVGEAIGANAVLENALLPNAPPVPIFNDDPSVPARVRVLFEVKVLPAPNVSVPVPVVIVLPFILVAVAAPMLGVVNTGLVEKTKLVVFVPVVPPAEVK